MSQMRMYCAGAGTIWVKVIGFSSSLDGTIVPSQTKQALHHFPRRAGHQTINFQIVCRNNEEKQRLIDFIRRHHKYALTSPANPEVVLWWPQRGIRDWSGIIKKVEGGATRFTVTPKVSFTMDLVDSLMSKKTWWSSRGDDFTKFFGTAIDAPSDWNPPLPLPSLPNPSGVNGVIDPNNPPPAPIDSIPGLLPDRPPGPVGPIPGLLPGPYG